MNKIVRVFTIIVLLVALIALLIGIVLFQKSESNVAMKDETNVSAINTNNSTATIEYSSAELAGEYTSYTAKIDLNDMSIIEGGGVFISDTTIHLSRAGVYYFTGMADEGNIEVNADNQEVVIVLDNVTLTSANTSVINVVDAKKVTINIPEGTTSTLTDGTQYTNQTDDEPNATIFSKDDLSIDGKGTLIVNGNYEDAIASKDGLKIVGTTIQITSVDDGIRGKDYVAIKDANIKIKAKGKGIKATEDSDTNYGAIIIDGGTIQVESEDDTLHSNNTITINGGTISLNAVDDGMHADGSIYINGGTIEITKSYEGLEATYIEINGGSTSVVATDDGVNICGGNDSFGMFQQDSFKSTSTEDINRALVINGGTLTVEANGDGLDSNGSIQMTGGTVIVGASTNGGNAALDYNYSFVISGGTLIAYGPTGMWQNPSTSSTQYTIVFQTTGKAGDDVVLKDANGKEVASFTAKRAYGMVAISTESLQQGESYTLYVNDAEVAAQELTSIVTSNGGTQGMMMEGRNHLKNGNMQNFDGGMTENRQFDPSQMRQNRGQQQMQSDNGNMLTPPEWNEEMPTEGDNTGFEKGMKRSEKKQKMIENT